MQTSWLRWVSSVLGVILSISVCAYCDDPSCFQVSSLNCSDLKSDEKCRRIQSDASSAQIFCCNMTTENEIVDQIKKLVLNKPIKVKGFHLRDSNLSRISQDAFMGLKSDLVSLSITETNILLWSGTFTENWPITCFNFSHNTLGSNISSQFIANLTNLRNFAISNSNITEIPDFPRTVSGLFTLDVSGNSFLLCRELVRLTTEIQKTNKSLTFVNRNSTTCVPPNFRDIRIQLSDVEKDVQVTFEKCPTFNHNKCECSVFSLDYAQGDRNDKDKDGVDRPYMYLSLVNCSNLGMQSLPNPLPPNTRVLDISNNSIKNFEGIGNETFNSLRELYADNNKINTLKHLEGTDFLAGFQNLTVRSNKIDQIQEYLFSNVFDRNRGGALMLAQNHFKCDCNTASKVKLWLTANKAHVLDYDQIYASCENYIIKVVDLNPKDFCSKSHNWRDYIRYIIGLEVLMFVLLIGKVSYDYYVFKTAGYLPWPASKMPKLPCDWCFET